MFGQPDEKAEEGNESAGEHQSDAAESPGVGDRQHPPARTEGDPDQSDGCADEDGSLTYSPKEDEQRPYGEQSADDGVGHIHDVAMPGNPLVGPIGRNKDKGRDAECELESYPTHHGDPDAARNRGCAAAHA